MKVIYMTERHHTSDQSTQNDTPIAEITVEQLTVYRYHIPMTDDVNDPEGIALKRFLAGEPPDAGPAEGDRHPLSTYYVGEVTPSSKA